MRKDFKVAIWMVTYNHEAYIEQAIESVMMQETKFKYHLYIGEDCSTDQTAKLCKTLQERYPDTITLILNDTNLGATANAFQMYDRCLQSGATYIAMLEGDDYWIDSLKLQKQVDYLEAYPEVVFSFTRFSTLQKDLSLKDNNARFFKTQDDLVFDFEMFTRGWYGGTLTLAFRSSAITMDKMKMYKYFRDIHLYTELLKVGHGRCLNFDSAVYRTHSLGVHTSATNLERAYIAVECYKELYTVNNAIVALKIKYYYFVTEYLKLLIEKAAYFRALVATIQFSFEMKDVKFAMKMLKKMIKSLQFTKRLKRLLKKKKRKNVFVNSHHYWEQRYQSDKDSGAGSYGRLADFKAEVLNHFVKNNDIASVIEYGCGDGHQLSLAKYPSYIGFDVSEKALEMCKSLFKADTSKSFYSMFDKDYRHLKADLVLSLDVIYHLIEDTVFDSYMQRLFDSSKRYVIIYSSNYDKVLTPHVKCRKFTDWIESHNSTTWRQIDYIPNRYPFDESDPNHTSMADFYIYERLRA